MNSFFTADNHFFHVNKKGTGIIDYSNRPFNNIEQMNQVLISNWNSKVKDKDLVYILGDFCFGKNCREILLSLKGRKILIVGSHDKTSLKHKNLFEKTTLRLEIKIGGHPTTFSHYCMRVWPKSHYNSWLLFGHSHGGLEEIGKSLDVGVDNAYKLFGEYRPFSEDEIKNIMEKKPDNFNYVGNRNRKK